MSIRVIGYRDGHRIVEDEHPQRAVPLPGWHPGGQAIVVPSEAARHRAEMREWKRRMRESNRG